MTDTDLFEWVFTCESIEEMSLKSYSKISDEQFEVPKVVNLPQIRRESFYFLFFAFGFFRLCLKKN